MLASSQSVTLKIEIGILIYFWTFYQQSKIKVNRMCQNMQKIR